MKNRGLLGAGVALAMALGGVQAHAQFGGMFGPYPPGVFYLGPEGGWTSLQSNTNSGSATVRGPLGVPRRIGFTETTNFDSGFNAGVRAGYEWGPWRFEGEWSYRNNNLSNFSGTVNFPGIVGTRNFSGSGNVFSGTTHSNAVMANAIYDFTFGWPVTPH